MEKKKRIGVLTGGGDAPALNSCVYSIFKYGAKKDLEIIGFLEGWKGILERKTITLGTRELEDILIQGGTILKTSRISPKVDALIKNLSKENIDILIVIGGNDTLSVAYKLAQKKFPVIGIPKTIDNDLSGTKYCIGFNTAVQNATNLIDKLRSTAKSHNRTFVIEIMGRETGWIAIKSGIASGAHVILIPEFKILPKDLYDKIRNRYFEGNNWSFIVVAEGAEFDGRSVFNSQRDPFGHVRFGGIGELIAEKIQKNVGVETRYTNLGHLIRGGNPSAYDRIMSMKLGVKAIDLASKNQTGKMIALRSGQLVMISLCNALTIKKVPRSLYQLANKIS